MRHITEDISFSPLFEELKGYSGAKFYQDAVSAFGVALVTIPQAMAYSYVAGLPFSAGIFSVLISAVICALMSTSRYLIIGPTNSMALLIQLGTMEIMHNFYRDMAGSERELAALGVVTLLGVLVGLFQFLVALFKMGRLIQFVSHSVVTGYLAGTACAVLIGQLPTFLGIELPGNLQSLLSRIYYIAFHASEIHLPTFITGAISLFLILMIKRVNTKLPSAVLMLVIVGVLVHLLGFSSYVETSWLQDQSGYEMGKVALVGDQVSFEGIIPHFTLPYFDAELLSHVIPIAFAIALLGALSSALVAKNISSLSGERISVNQEILSLGTANMIGSLFGAMPSAASPTRCTMLMNTGAKTRLAIIYCSLFVGIIVAAFEFIISRAPLTALSAIIFVSATQIVSFKQFLLCLKATRADRLVTLATLLTCLVLSLDVAFYIGVAISITLYLQKAAVPQLIECAFDNSGKIGAFKNEDRDHLKEIRVINVHGELFFGAADLFQSAVKALTEHDNYTQVMILRLKNARDIDATTCLALQQLHAYLKSSKRHLICCGITHLSWEILSESGTMDVLGRDNLFILDELHPQLSLKNALQRANALVKPMQDPLPQTEAIPEQALSLQSS